ADLVAVNAGEAAELAAAFGRAVEEIPVPMLVVTRGADGAALYRRGEQTPIAPFPVTPVDTTGAGDTFLGSLLAGFEAGLSDADAGRRASAAAALQITRQGAADAIPTAAEVDHFLSEQPR
ncbi:MAG: PfkB family carbohydrate kinase, partial [Pseudomonadota bacterium]